MDAPVEAASGAGRIPLLSNTMTSYLPDLSIHNAVDTPKIPLQVSIHADPRHSESAQDAPAPTITTLVFCCCPAMSPYLLVIFVCLKSAFRR